MTSMSIKIEVVVTDRVGYWISVAASTDLGR